MLHLSYRAMSIATKTGDDGSTGMMYGRRLPKSHPRVEALGTVDEVNAALGLARAHLTPPEFLNHLLAIQSDLIGLMGELATLPEDRIRYENESYARLTPQRIAFLDSRIQELESQLPAMRGWAVPGANVASATLDVARTTCRRAERRIHALQTDDPQLDPQILVYLNRLGDLLWLMARAVEGGA